MARSTRYEYRITGRPDGGAGELLRANYAVARGGVTVATVSQRPSLRQRFAIEVADGQDPVLMLAVILVIEAIRDQRRDSAGAAGAASAGGLGCRPAAPGDQPEGAAVCEISPRSCSTERR
jgi:hypothetical protein